MMYRRMTMLVAGLLLGVSMMWPGGGVRADAPGAAGEAAAPAANVIYVIPIRGMIDDVMLESLKRRAAAAEAAGAKQIVLEMDTPGGLVTSALSICNYLKRTKLETIAWVNHDAYSAGAMISVACDQIVMAPRSSIGDCAPIMIDPTGSGMSSVGETERAKMESPILEEFRDSAQRNGYSVTLSEAMVKLGPAVYMIRDREKKARFVRETELEHYGLKVADFARGSSGDGEWVAVKKVLNENELLTLSQDQAVEFGFARKIIADEKELAAYLGRPDAAVARMETTWSEKLTSFLTSPAVRGLLMMVLMLCGYMELQSPGLGLPGALALGALIVLIAAPYMTGLADAVDVLLILGGIVLIAVELLILPGLIIPGVLGVLMLLGGMLMSFVPPEPDRWLPSLPATYEALEQGMLVMTVSIAAGIIGFILLTRYFGTIPMLSRLVLTSERTEAVLAAERAVTQGPWAVTTGMTGRVVSTLRPVGVAEFDGQRVDVVTTGPRVEMGRSVRVTEVHGNRVVVEEA